MKRVLALIFTGGAGISLALMLLLPAGAATGGTISLGTVSANSVQVNTTAAIDAWSGYNVHVGTVSSAGVVLGSIGGANGTALGGSTFCPTTVPAPGEFVFGCVGLGGQAVTAAGLLATFTFNATGNGCIVVRLMTLPGDAVNDTYTIDANLGAPQTNIVSTATANVLIGTGTVTDCGGGPAPTNTPTSTNTTVPATNTPTRTPTNTTVPATSTPTRTPTNTPVPPTNTPTRTPTNTPLPGVPTNTPTSTNTSTPVVPTPTRTATNTPGAVPTATNTAVAGGPTSTATPPGASGCPDLDGDGGVGDSDIVEAARSFGRHHGDDTFDSVADRDGDHAISVLDLTSIAKHHGQTCHDGDHDGVSDEDEVIDGTDPSNADSDGDNYTDGEEMKIGKSATAFCKVMRADLDKDHRVSIVDLAQTAAVYQTAAGNPKFKATSDFDHDGKITILDLAYQGGAYGKRVSTCP